MKKIRIRIGRLGPPENLRAGGVMDSANRKKDAARARKLMRKELRRGDWD